MNWTDQVFQYCERGADIGFWAEPLNALTNFGFLIVALYHWRKANLISDPVDRLWNQGLAGLVGIIGVGSFLFHTYATRWAAVADFTPISILMLAYLATLLRLVRKWRWPAVLAAVLLFFLINLSMGKLRCGEGGPCLNGSLSYLPSLLLIATFGLLVQGEARQKLQMASGVFLLSAVFRTLDQDYCHLWQISDVRVGSHFMWHILNAFTLHLLLSAARTLSKSR